MAEHLSFNRQPTRPRRVKITPIMDVPHPTIPGEIIEQSVPGLPVEFYAKQDMADEPYEGMEGIPWEQEFVLTPQVAAELGLDPVKVNTPNDAFMAIAGGAGKSGDAETALQIANRIYSGMDLTIKFAAEIASYATVWDWIKARIQIADFNGINIGDYIPWEATNGYKVISEAAGIDTYYNYGDIPVGHHIDFISRGCWPEPIPFNLVNNNNGTSVSPSPWLASNLYAKLNSLQMQVPNSAANNTTLTTVDYRTTGVYDKLPTSLKNVISPKRLLLPQRYTAGSLLTADNNWGWTDAGKLWIPSENEIYGCEHWGSKNGYSSGGFQQYPIFAHNMKRIKGAGEGGARSIWWSLSASGGNSANAAAITNGGNADYNNASYASVRATLCFRIDDSR